MSLKNDNFPFASGSGDSTEGGVAEDLYNRGDSGGGDGITRSVPKAPRKLGFQKLVGDPRLYSFDRYVALSKSAVSWDVTRDDRMPKDEAGQVMRRIIQLYGLSGESPSILEAFHNAVYYALTVNSGSVLQPGRAKFYIAGNEFDYFKVIEHLGPDLRRFSRAYADEIRDNNIRVLNHSDPGDYLGMERAEAIRQVASARGLSRFPDLAHDSADACSSLSDAERAALVSSKTMVFSAGQNMADRNRLRPGQSGSTVAGSMFVNPSAPAALGDH